MEDSGLQSHGDWLRPQDAEASAGDVRVAQSIHHAVRIDHRHHEEDTATSQVLGSCTIAQQKANQTLANKAAYAVTGRLIKTIPIRGGGLKRDGKILPVERPPL